MDRTKVATVTRLAGAVARRRVLAVEEKRR